MINKANYIFSNCAGVFVFDESFRVIDKSDVSEQDTSRIAAGEWISAEKKLIEKHSKESDSYYVGFKNEKIDGVKITQDPNKLEPIIKHFRNREFLARFYEINLLKTKMSVRGAVKEDLLLIQAIHNIEELDRMANSLSKRLREWYELYNPEYSRSVADHRAFVRNVIANTKEELLKKINLTKEKSMGADLSAEDYAPIKKLAKDIETLYTLRDEQVAYVESVTARYCPHLRDAAGALIAAKLISLAGSSKRLAELPSSTVQLLGAEKALFRHMKTGAKPPKYGIIMQHPDIANAERTDRGKAARHLSHKLTIAARQDYFAKKENQV